MKHLRQLKSPHRPNPKNAKHFIKKISKNRAKGLAQGAFETAQLFSRMCSVESVDGPSKFSEAAFATYYEEHGKKLAMLHVSAEQQAADDHDGEYDYEVDDDGFLQDH